MKEARRPRSRTGSLVVLSCVSALLVGGFASRDVGPSRTAALHSARLAASSHRFDGASFVPLVAPVVSPTITSGGTSLAWDRVVTSGGVDANYRVVRTDAGGQVDVCGAPNTPALSGQKVTCLDTTAVADVTYTYTEQPVLVRNGTLTWSRPPSTPSVAVTMPRVVLAGVGTTVSATGSTISVPYPTGTRVGDILLLVAVSGRQSAPLSPAGWTTLASIGVSGTSAFRLFVAWRVADAATSVTLDPSANSTGATLRILRYVQGRGLSVAPVVATAQVVTANGAVSTQFTPSPDVVTSGSNAEVVNVVALRALGALGLSTPRGFRLDDVESLSPGSVDQSVGIAGLRVLTAGQVPLPTWSSTAGAIWLSATLAFR